LIKYNRKNKKYHTVGTVPKSITNIIERDKIDTTKDANTWPLTRLNWLYDWFGLWWLMPLSTIFQLYRSSRIQLRFYDFSCHIKKKHTSFFYEGIFPVSKLDLQ
jgi:hypothetical protein